VIARNQAFAYKGKPLDAKTVCRELNVLYVLEGSVQRGGSRMRLKSSSSMPNLARIYGSGGRLGRGGWRASRANQLALFRSYPRRKVGVESDRVLRRFVLRKGLAASQFEREVTS